MFTWICPKCKAEVPPSYTECPNCISKKAEVLPEQPSSRSAGVADRVDPPVQTEVRPSPVAVPVPPPQQRAVLSPTLVAILATAGIAGILALLYFVILPTRKSPIDNAAPVLEQPGTAASAQSANPFAKHLEMSGIRLSGEGGRAKLQFVMVNHSAAELPELRLHIQLIAGGKTEFEFPFTIPSLGPFESRDLSTTIKTDLKPYEWPDWQLIRPQFRVLN